MQRGMSSQEVVISDKKDRQVDCAGHTFESGAGTGMEFISPIEAFDQLLQGTILFTDIILVGETDDSLAENDVPVGMLIVCHDRIVIRPQTVFGEDKTVMQIAFRRTVGIVDGCQCRDCSTGIGKIVTAECSGAFIDNKPGVMLFIFDSDVSLIGSSAMTGFREIPIQPRSNDRGAGFDVIEHGLMGKTNSEQSLQNFPGLTGRQADVHEKTQHQTNCMVRGSD